jgi:hypothetical protein
MITKMFCGRAPTETVWPGVHNIITKGEFEKMTSKRVKTKTPMGVLPLKLKYWLSNYNHTQHIIFPSHQPYRSEDLVAIPSETAQIRAYQASGRMSPIDLEESPAKSRVTKATENDTSKKKSDATNAYPPSPATTTLGSRQSDIKTFMTPSKQASTRVNEIIDISTNESTKPPSRKESVTDSIVPTLTALLPTRLPELKKRSSTVEETTNEKDVSKVQPTTTESPVEMTATATIDTNVDRNVNDNRIVQAAVEASVNTTPRATTPPPTIDPVLVNTTVLNEHEAAEALGELSVTTIEGSKTKKVTNKRKTTTRYQHRQHDKLEEEFKNAVNDT